MLLFVVGYFLGGFSALVILGLTVAARSGDQPRIHELPIGRRREDIARGYHKR